MLSDSQTSADVRAESGPGPLGGVEPDERAQRPAPAIVAWMDRWPWMCRPLAIFVVSRIVTVATLAVSVLYPHNGITNEIDRWDSKWFLRAAEYGWPSHLPQANGHVAGNTIAFFPLFPSPSAGLRT